MKKNYPTQSVLKLLATYLIFLSGSLFSYQAFAQASCTINAGDLSFNICEGAPFEFTGKSIVAPNKTTWTQIAGPAVVFEDKHDPKSKVFGMTGGNTYKFRFSADCTQETQEVTVVVQPITKAAIITDNIASCPDSNIPIEANTPLNPGETGKWEIVGYNYAGLTIGNSTSPQATINLPTNSSGTTTLAWVITGPEYKPGKRCSTQDTFTVTNYGGRSPVSAGSDKTLSQCYTTITSTRLSGSYGGTGLNGQQGEWTFVSGPSTPRFSNANTYNPAVYDLIGGTYVFRWTVTGPCVSGSDEVTVTVLPATQSVTSLSGTTSYSLCDGSDEFTLQGRPAPQYAGETVQWSKRYTSSPTSSSTIESPNSPSTRITGLSAEGVYYYKYTITNQNTGCSDFKYYTIYVRGPVTLSANNGEETIIGTCGQTKFRVPLDSGGNGRNYYRIISGPAEVSNTYRDAGSSYEDLTLTKEGTYVVEFRRISAYGSNYGCGTAKDLVKIVVSKLDNPPNAGVDFAIDCGTTSAELEGNVPKAGTPFWSQISGPSSATFDNPYTTKPTVSNLQAGTYEFQYVFLDGGNTCEMAPDTVSLFVANSTLSTAAAGTDQSVCYGAPVYMNANEPATGEKGTWTADPNNPSAVSFSDINDPKAVVTGLTVPSRDYKFTWTIDYEQTPTGTCASPSSSEIIITTGSTPAPSPADAGGDQCLNSGIRDFSLEGNTPDTGTTGTWTVEPYTGVTIADANDPTTSVTVLEDGQYTFTWTITDDSNVCTPTKDDVLITIAEPAAATASANPGNPVCGNSVTMNGTLSSGSTGEWLYVSGPGGFDIDDKTDPNTSITFTNSGTYKFKWTVTAGNCSTAEAEVEVQIGIPPTPANAGLDQQICNQTSVTLGGNSFDPATETGVWTLVSGPYINPYNGGFNPRNPNTSINNLVTGTYVFQWTITSKTNTICDASSDTVTIEVVTPANTGVSPTKSFCKTNLDTATDPSFTFPLTAAQNTKGTWTTTSKPTGATVALNQSPADDPKVNVTIDTKGDYEFTFTPDNPSTSCTLNPFTVTVTVSGAPSENPNAGPDQEICKGAATAGSATLAGNDPSLFNDGTTGKWRVVQYPSDNEPTFTDATSPTTIINGLTKPGIYLLEWKFTNGSCTNLSDVMKIQVYEKPGPVDAGDDQLKACIKDFKTNATEPTSGLGEWEIVSAPANSNTTIDSPNNPVTGLSNIIKGEYILKWTVTTSSTLTTGDCAPESDTVTVTFNDEPPSEPEAGPDQELCNETQTRMDATPVTSGKGTWSQISGPNNAVILSVNDPRSRVFDLVPGDYEFQWQTTTTNEDGCVFNDTVKITVIEEPSAAEAGPDQTLIEFSPVTLSADPVTIGTGVWSQVSGPSAANFIDPTDPQTPVSGTTVGTYVFEWTVSNGVCTAKKDQVTITIMGSSDLDITKSVSPTSANVGDVVTFSISIFNDDSDPVNADATGISVLDDLPAGYALVSGTVSNNGLYNFGNSTITWSGLEVPSGDTLILTYQAKINAPTGATDEYKNSVEITGSDQFDPDSTPDNDDNSEDDQDSVTITIQEADLSLAKTVSPANASVGDEVTFTVQVSNAGGDAATNVTIEDVLPLGYSAISAISNGGVLNGNTLTWDLASVPVGTNVIALTYKATVNAPTGAADEYKNTVEVTASDQKDPNSTPDNNDANEDDQSSSGIVLENADLNLTKSVSPTSARTGDEITFTITVENVFSANSTGDATGVSVADVLPSGYTIVTGSASNGGSFDAGSSILLWNGLTIANGDTVTLTYKATVNAATGATDEYKNTAQVTASDLPDPDSTPDNNDGTEDDQDTATITITPDSPPVAENDNSTGNTPGDAVAVSLVGNDTDSDGTIDPTKVDLVESINATDIITDLDGDVIGFTEPGEGVWKYEEVTGELTFTPENGFTGNPTPITYTVKDNDGNESNAATVTIEYTPTAPTVADDEDLNNPIGSTVVLDDVLTNDTLSDGSTPSPSDVTFNFVDGSGAPQGTTYTVPGEGVWMYDDTTGAVTFTPDAGSTDDPTIVEYTITDKDNNQTSTPATITVTYQNPPVAEDDDSTGNTPGDAVPVSILDNDTDSDGTIDPTKVNLVELINSTDIITDLDGDVIGFTVPGEGVWKYDEVTGELTFTPEDGFTGNPTPVDYTVKDNDGNTSNVATVTISYNQIPPVVEDDSSTDNDTGSSVTLDVLTNDALSDNTIPSPADVQFDFIVPSGATSPITGPNGNTIGFTVPGEGEWLYDEATGAVTFTPETGFTNDPTPVDYHLTDVDTGLRSTSPATITIDYAIEFPVTQDDMSENNQIGNDVSISILANDSDPDGTLDPTSVDLIAPSNAQNTVTDANGNVIGFEVLNEGTWTYDPTTETLVFSPNVGFFQDPTPISYTVDDNDGNQSNISLVTIDYQDVADLFLTKIVVDNDITPLVGSEITFQITVTNDGPQDATGVEVTDLLPSGYDFVLFSSTVGNYDETTGLWTVGNIASGVSETLLIDALVLPTGEYKNVAQVTKSDVRDIDSDPNNDDGDQSQDDEDSAIVTPVTSNSDLSLTKAVVDGDVTPVIGQEITFKLTVRNDGPQDATGVEVTDLLPSGYDFATFSSSTGTYDETTGIWYVGNLANQQVETLLIDVTVKPSGDYLNTAEISSSDVLDVDSTPGNGDTAEDDYAEAVTTPVQQLADLSLTKAVVDGDVTPVVGQEITFKLTVRNDGPQDATGVEVTDLLPSGYDFATFSSSTGTYDETTGIWYVGNLANQQVETLLIDVTVKPSGEYLNTAEISASDVIDVDSTPGNGNTAEDDYAEAETTPIQQIADLSISKTTVGGVTNAQPGEKLRFQVTVKNQGPAYATNVEVVDVLPAGFSYQQYSATSGVYDKDTGLWRIGTIPADGSQTLFVEVQVNDPQNIANEFVNFAEITAVDQVDPNSDPSSGVNVDDFADGIPDDDEASFKVKVGVADLELIKSVSDPNANVGDVVTFTLQVNNAGPNVATGVAIEDVLPIGYGSITNISEGGTETGGQISWSNLTIPLTGLTITYDAVVNAPTSEDGEYNNVAQVVASDQYDPNSTPNNDDGNQSENDESSASIKVPTTDIAVNKKVDDASPSIDDLVNFTISAINKGELSATNVEISEILPSGYQYVESTTSTGSYDDVTGVWEIPVVGAGKSETLTIKVKVLDVDDYVNTASLQALDQVDGNPNNDSGSSTITPICLSIPSKFSPNGNGENDTFYIDCIDRYTNNTLKIYNRWGNVVYSKKGYDNTFDGLSNGRSIVNKDRKLPVGTYYYILDLGDGSAAKVGWIYLAR